MKDIQNNIHQIEKNGRELSPPFSALFLHPSKASRTGMVPVLPSHKPPYL